MSGRRYDDTQNGYGKRIFRLEVLAYLILGKLSFFPDVAVQDFAIQVWRVLF